MIFNTINALNLNTVAKILGFRYPKLSGLHSKLENNNNSIYKVIQ